MNFLQNTHDLSWGFLDSISLSVTSIARQELGVDYADYDGIAYSWGNTAGTAAGLAGAGKKAFGTYTRRQKAKAWRGNSKTSRKTRNKKIKEAGGYAGAATDAATAAYGAGLVSDAYNRFSN